MSKPKSTENIYSSAVVQALEQQYCSSCSAAVVSPCSSMGNPLNAKAKAGFSAVPVFVTVTVGLALDVLSTVAVAVTFGVAPVAP